MKVEPYLYSESWVKVANESHTTKYGVCYEVFEDYEVITYGTMKKIYGEIFIAFLLFLRYSGEN